MLFGRVLTGERRTGCELSSRRMNALCYLPCCLLVLADTLTTNNSFNKEDRMSSDRKVGNYDRQEKNEAKQHGDVSSPLGFTLLYIQLLIYFQSARHLLKKQPIHSDFEVTDELSAAMYENMLSYSLPTP